VTAADLAGGTHEVQIKTLLGKLVTRATVDVPVDQQVRFEYAAKTLTQTGSGALPQRPAVVVVEAPASSRAMGSAAYSALLGELQGASFDRDRLERARAAAASNGFTCAQVAGLLRTFQFDAERLNAAEALAPRAVDPENAALVAGAFEFSTNGEKAAELVGR
jgi:hypothetical protein